MIAKLYDVAVVAGVMRLPLASSRATAANLLSALVGELTASDI
jgi:hypothetical protein